MLNSELKSQVVFIVFIVALLHPDYIYFCYAAYLDTSHGELTAVNSEKWKEKRAKGKNVFIQDIQEVLISPNYTWN